MMNPAPGASRYLDGRVTTASQSELHLMLLDGAIRFGRLAAQAWEVEGQQAEWDRLLGRCLDIVEEVVRSVSHSEVAVAKRLEEEYAFAFRQLAVARLNRDLASLENALSVLSFERETWKLACEKLRSDNHEPQFPASPQPRPIPGSAAASFDRMAPITSQGLSLQG